MIDSKTAVMYYRGVYQSVQQPERMQYLNSLASACMVWSFTSVGLDVEAFFLSKHFLTSAAKTLSCEKRIVHPLLFGNISTLYKVYEKATVPS